MVRGTSAIEKASAQLAEDAKLGIPALEKALADFSKVHQEDRLFAPRQAALLKLTSACQKAGLWERATKAANAAYRGNPKDIRARRLWVQCLLSSGESPDTGYRELAQLVHEFPGHEISTRRFVELALQRGDFEAAGTAGLRYFLSTGVEADALLPKGDWLGWWMTNEPADGFHRDRCTKADVRRIDNRFTVRFKIPSGQSAIRVDLPAASELCFEIESMRALFMDGSTELDLTQAERRIHHLTASGNLLQANREADPWISINLPKDLMGSDFTLQMSCRIEGAADWLSQALTQPNVLEEVYLLAERERFRAVHAIRRIQLQQWSRTGLQFEWLESPGITTLRKDTEIDGRYHFLVELDVPLSGAEWILNPAACYNWHIGGVEAKWKNQPGTVQRKIRSMEQLPSGILAGVWTDASYSLELQGPRDANSPSRVSISGWIQ